MKVFKVVGSLLVVLLIGVYAFMLTVDGMVKSKIEESGMALLSTKVEVDDVDISIFDSQAEINGFAVYNPEGFSKEKAISFEDIKLDLDPKSLFADTIIIDRIYVENPEILFEQKGNGINLRELNSNLSSSSNNGNSKPVVINTFILEEAEILILSDLDKERRVKGTMNRMELYDIGREGSNTVDDAMQQILEPIIEKALVEAVKSGVLDRLQNVVDDFINN